MIMHKFQGPRTVVSAVLILIPIFAIMGREIESAANWNFYPSTSSRVTNLTQDRHLWMVTYYNGDEMISQEQVTIPRSSYGKVPSGVTRMTLSTHLTSPADARPDLALHLGTIFANNFAVYLNGTQITGHSRMGNNGNVPLPEAHEFEVTLDLDVAGISEPGIDLRSNVLIGDRVLLDNIYAEIKEKDHSLVLWLVVPRLVIGALFALGSLIFVYGLEYQLFALFSLVSGIKTATSYGELGLIFPSIVDGGTLTNTLHLLSVAIFLLFLNAFFRRRNRWTQRTAAGIGLLAVSNLVLSRMWPIGPEIFAPVFFAAHILQQVICGFGAVVAWQTFCFLKQTKRSFPRQMISITLAALFTIAIPVISYMATATNLYWLGGPLFELCFVLVMASCVSTDIGGVRAERDSIRRKLGMFVDEAKVADIISTRLEQQQWKENVTVMFIDIRNFCVMNEVFGPNAIFDAVNDYYRVVIDTVYQYGGVVDKFIGDGVLAVWGITGQSERPELQCMHAALTLRQRMRHLNDQRLAQGKFQFAVGMGIHSGRVTYGLIGSDERAEFTVIGSTVNVAARIEKQTKRVFSDILMSESSYELLREELIVCPRGTTDIVEEIRSFEVFQPIALIDAGRLLINDPIYEAMALEPKPSKIPHAPKNLVTYHYAEFAGQVPASIKKVASS